jgi:polysaccharide export outer membrane protein
MILKKRLTKIIVLAALVIFFQGCASMKGGKADEDLSMDKALLNERPAEVAEFILGPGDKLDISVYRNPDLTKTIQIGPGGMLDYPLVGSVQAAGLSIFQLKKNLAAELGKYIKNPQVSISVISTSSRKITVLGEVRRPGFFQIEGNLTTLEAISGAGGFTLDGKKSSVLLIRGGLKKPVVRKLDLLAALGKGDMSQNVTLVRGDIIYVPRTAIANVDRFFNHLSTILNPLLDLERGYYIGQQIERSNSGSRLTVPVR